MFKLTQSFTLRTSITGSHSALMTNFHRFHSHYKYFLRKQSRSQIRSIYFYLYHKKIQSVNIHSKTFCRHTSFTRSRKMIISCIRKEGASRAFPFNKNIQNWDSKMHLTSTTLIWLLSGTRFGFIFIFFDRHKC